ncbi:hypothetical protein SERLADRAFT_380903 [Serpula lacrymans var. lacrymans S7.9]|uniref:Uncharacterized protein n=1 Tax=Serpula lacrymans var. lacrymans (strain S7.9) TaxID=578457 RepID=F8NKL4_SERL9|nr:uncharacterized protein SERLADRAFT_380903 [Serpula lacrymans var. lacrymans S7.9]EGO28786.1 hypothetical protein SERLADRAFT_380903 [Serpula lacrymans var. lacrymans S7.9]
MILAKKLVVHSATSSARQDGPGLMAHFWQVFTTFRLYPMYRTKRKLTLPTLSQSFDFTSVIEVARIPPAFG